MPSDNRADEDAATKEYRDRRILDTLIVVVGFGLCRSWIVFCLVAPFSLSSIFTASWLYLLCGALAALAVAFIVGREKERIARVRRLLYWATGIALVLSAVIIPLASAQHLEVITLIGFIVGGMGAGMLQVLWGERFAHYRIRFATIVSPAAAIVTAFLVSFSSLGSTLIGYIAFPLLSFALLVLIADRTGIKATTLFKLPSQQRAKSTEAEQHPANVSADKQKTAGKKGGAEPSQEKEPESARVAEGRQRVLPGDVWKLMVSIMVFSFLCRAFDAIPIRGADPFAFFGGSALMSLVFVGAVFLLFVALLKDRFNAAFTYRLSLPIMVAGLVAIALFFDTHAALSVLFINIGYEFFDILSWILFTEIARGKDEQPLRIFGFGVAFMFIGMTLGLLVGEIISALILSGSVQITVIAMLSILSLVVVAFLVIPEGTITQLAQAINPEKKEGAGAESADTAETGEPAEVVGEGRHERSCAQAAEDYRLTPRESEVLVLLAYGRTLTIIARDLHIAKGTARTHIESIYRKLDVHKQQELIDLIEDYELR